jgi:hypothetical protein
MPNYSEWEPRQVDVVDLQLDPLNPRLPALGIHATERVIIEELLKHEDVHALAKGIGLQGFFPTEVLVCVEDDDNLFVVEGNRRLASLKLLTSPELAPEGEQEKFRVMRASSLENVPEKVNVVVAPSRTSTISLIMNKHTRTGVKSWEPLQQAQYVTSLLGEHVALEDLPNLTGIPRAEILNNLRTHSLYEMAKRLPLDQPTSDIVSDPRKFSASTLERVSGSPDFRKFLGIDFDEEGGVVGNIDPDEFERAYTEIIKRIAQKKLDTRKLNSAELIRKEIRSLASVKPDKSKIGTFTSANFLAAEQIQAQAAAMPASKPQPRKKTQSSLIAKSFRCNLSMERIKAVLWELQHLKVADYENSVGVLLRIFIELSTSHYMDQTGQMVLLIAQINKGSKQPKAADWTPTLRQMLGYLMAKDNRLVQTLPRQALKAINKAIADDDYALSSDGMDQFVHNPYVGPQERQLRQFWNAFEKFVEFMMEDHARQKGPNP